MENRREYIYTTIKDSYVKKIGSNPNFVDKVDETLIVLEAITGTTFEKKEKKY